MQIKLGKVFQTVCKLGYFSVIGIYQVKSNYSASVKAPL